MFYEKNWTFLDLKIFVQIPKSNRLNEKKKKTELKHRNKKKYYSVIMNSLNYLHKLLDLNFIYT